MSLRYERVVREDLNLGYGSVRVSMPAGGTALGTLIGLHTFTGTLNVKDFGAAGDGVTDDYTAIVAAYAALTGTGHPGTLYFPPGVYAYSTPLNLIGTNIRLVGDNAILYFRGSGIALQMVGGAIQYGGGIENLTIRGTANCTKGLVLDYVRHGSFRNVSVQDVATSGVELLHAVYNTFENIRVSNAERAFLVRPQNGVYLDTTAVGNTFINTMIDGCSNAGIAIWNGTYNTFLGGHAFGASIGVLVLAGGHNSFHGFEGRDNTSYDFSIYAPNVLLESCVGLSVTAASLVVQAGARQAVVLNSNFYSVDLMAGSYSTSFINSSYAQGGAGTFLNNGTNTLLLNGYNATTELPQTNLFPGPFVFGDTDSYMAFYGGAAVQQQTLATGAGRTVDQVIAALQALGLVKQS